MEIELAPEEDLNVFLNLFHIKREPLASVESNEKKIKEEITQKIKKIEDIKYQDNINYQLIDFDAFETKKYLLASDGKV